MANATKKYVDLAGLTEFKSKLLDAYSKNNLTAFAAFAVAKATNADAATKATQDASGNVITSTYTPMARTIAGVDLQDNITKAEMLTALNVADGAQVNVLEGVKFKASGASAYTDLSFDTTETKKVLLDLSGYALKSDLVAVLKFMGVKDYVKDLPTASADTVGHIWHVKYRGESGTSPLNAEFVGVDMGSGASPRYKWEEMGAIVDLSAYKKWEDSSEGAGDGTKSYIDAHDSTTLSSAKTYADGLIAALDAEITSTDGSKVTVKVTEVDGKITAVNVTESDIASAATLATVDGDATTAGSFRKYTTDAIAALDATVTQADTDRADGLSLSVTETDGKLTAVSGAIKANTFDAYGSASTAESNAKSYTDAEIKNLDYTSTGAAGSYVQKVAETDGKIAETIVAFDTSIGSTSTDNNAPTSKAAYDCAKAFYDDIDAVTTAEIDALFPSES